MARADGRVIYTRWSASASRRLGECPGSLALGELKTLGEEKGAGDAADYGSATHRVADNCLTLGHDPEAFRGDLIEGWIVDDEMIDLVRAYTGYVWASVEVAEADNVDEEPSEVESEKWFDFEALFGELPFPATGMADAVIYHPGESMVEIVDLKTGRIDVSPRGNTQLLSYAAAAVDELRQDGKTVEYVRLVIVQPRTKDGPEIADITAEKLATFTGDLGRSILQNQLAWEALHAEALDASPGWARTWLHSGDHCDKCPVRDVCRGVEQKTWDAVKLPFRDETAPMLLPDPESLTNEELARFAGADPALRKWLDHVQAVAIERATGGEKIPGMRLEKKTGARRWTSTSKTAGLAIAATLGVDPDLLYERKLKSLSQIEKTFGDDTADRLQGHWRYPNESVKLVQDKTGLGKDKRIPLF